jgi:hypothetical protein
MSPAYADQAFGQYADAVNTGATPSNANANPLSSYNNNGYDSNFQPRGSFPVKLTVGRFNGAGVYQDASLVSSGPTDSWKVAVQFTATEPFLALSPFLNTCPMNNSGLLGINNMSIVANIDSTCKRLMGTAKTVYTASACNPAYITGLTLGYTSPAGAPALTVPAFQATRLLFNFQTLQPEQYARLSSKNICGYSDFPRYLTTFNNSDSVASLDSKTLTSQNLQLNQVPSLIMIAVRVPMSTQQISNASSFLEIENISINFNSQSGLLASATKQDLFQISARNGGNQSYYEWDGAVSNISTVGANQGKVSDVAGTGSLLVLNPALDFSMPSFLTGGSLGQFSLQFNIRVKNQYAFAITPEIVIITKNDGIFVSQQGTSVIYTALLDKQTVLRTKEQAPMLDWNHHQRLVGGKLSNMALSALGKIGKYYRAKKGDVAEAKEAFQGSGISGGGISGGGISGGRHRLSRHLM